MQDRFQRWSVLTLDKNTSEWDVLSDQLRFELYTWDDARFEGKLPDIQHFTVKDGRSILLVDEAPLMSLGTEKISQLERMFAHGSSHRSLMHQRVTDVPI